MVDVVDRFEFFNDHAETGEVVAKVETFFAKAQAARQ